ncbi:sensor histidine kinase [Cohnella nanjingensis]|uniref:histidine kinase n=1 Tax=Cohnella nanjingensis TaxID=1387779 RepID=A0A7X0RVZ5_9BACL|nr:sensor histidine kinase [Cohnella nanjingensis]MBB6673129.1 sensor histidine kinase [Cohnella nanjingensis]
MRLGKIYRNYIRNNLFTKVIVTFAAIVIVTIITLSYLLFNFMSASIVESELDNQREAMDRVSRYIDEKYEWVQNAIADVYRNDTLAASASYLLTHPYQDYVQYTLDRAYAGGDDSSSNILAFLRDRRDTDPDIRNLILYSAERQEMYVYMPFGTRKLFNVNRGNSYVPDVMSAEGPVASTPNVWVRKTIGQWDQQLYSMRAQLNDKNTLKNIGQFLVYFDSGLVSKSLAQAGKPLKGKILVLTPDGQVMFDSSGRGYGETYPYMSELQSPKPVEQLDEPSYVSLLTQNKAGYLVVGISPKREVAKAYEGLRRTIILISAACIAVAVVIPSLVVARIAKRTNKIVRFIRKVEGGDLGARLQDPREDELGQISQSFNEMLDELNRRIDREYKAEIRIKQTELAALQARVNPHFLYNTLEVIRMRAMSQGAKDVGEMIYSLAALFRNVVHTGESCTLSEELEMCRLYLELFRIRYKDKFAYTIECDPALANVAVFKMLLQPIVENYIVHGLETQRSDNRLTIAACRDEESIVVRFADNGRGIAAERLRQIRQALELPEAEGQGVSFGLRSVHDRLRLVYGPPNGVNIESEPGSGTEVTVRWPGGDEKGAANSDV